MNDEPIKIKASQHESYWSYTALAILLPGIGIILGILYMAKDNKLDKRLGEHTLALSVLGLLIWATGIGVWQMLAAEHAQLQQDALLESIYAE